MKSTIISIYDKVDITTGAHKRHIGLLKELKERGYRILLFSPVDYLNHTENHFRISPYTESIIPKSLQTVFAVRKKYQSYKKRFKEADIILVFGFNHIYASLYLKKKLKIPLIFALRSNVYMYRKMRFKNSQNNNLTEAKDKIKGYFYLQLFKNIEKYVYKKSDKIVVQNKEDYTNLMNTYSVGCNKVDVIRNNVNFFKTDVSPVSNQSLILKNIIFVGTLSERKGIMLLVKAVNDLIKDGHEIELDILGDGHLYNHLQAYIRSGRLENNISMHGFVDNPLEYIAKSDLLIMPSLFDSFPNSVLEALSVKTPVIGSKVAGNIEILKYQSLLFEPDSVSSIKKKIVSLFDEEFYKKSIEQCKKRRNKLTFDWPGEFEKVISAI
jgi:glycosyltransferase involved in cell wall biosynthesis